MARVPSRTGRQKRSDELPTFLEEFAPRPDRAPALPRFIPDHSVSVPVAALYAALAAHRGRTWPALVVPEPIDGADATPSADRAPAVLSLDRVSLVERDYIVDRGTECRADLIIRSDGDRRLTFTFRDGLGSERNGTGSLDSGLIAAGVRQLRNALAAGRVTAEHCNAAGVLRPFPTHYWSAELGDALLFRDDMVGLPNGATASLGHVNIRRLDLLAEFEPALEVAPTPSLPPSLSPYLIFMLRASAAVIEPGKPRPGKKEVVAWIEDHWPVEFGERAPRKVQPMATFLRWPEDQKGGAPRMKPRGETTDGRARARKVKP